MDTESSRINVEVMHHLIDQADHRLLGMVGMEALHALALEMTTEQFASFIEGAVDRAKQMGQQAQLKPLPPKTAGAQPDNV